MTRTETDAPQAEQKPVNVQQTLLDGLGGPMGMLCTTLPVVVFVTATAFLPLTPSIGIALAGALALTGFRLLRGEKPSSALGGVLAIAVAGGVAAWTGSAKDFFLIGIWASLAGAVVVLVSMLAGRPLTGVIWNLLHGGGNAWRQNRSALRAHHLASLAVLLVFAGRFVVKEWLYLTDSTGWLAFAKIAMGTPLTALAALVVLWSFRRTTKVLKR
ncbi:DUF3159 domain-containing protein [Saccharopolyspora karakumensis]|uniref:DUF3159 domain-containing protein n=1 Tax=Saccharopolyspora karakumensis TaxID=2530386 RepID=A0A4R5BGK9_9PSEU|nr:DUF3159 domain-containing protein [Saccharopolyspora karakumensis]TDD85541.1 DUF3159 domain-containing protein [Saccharopolyspora karakumensis]